MPATPDFKERLKKITVRNMSVKHRTNTNWPMEKKIEVVSQFLVLGNMKMVAAMTGVSYDLIRQWKTQAWWKDLENEIRQTQNIEMDTKLSKIVDRSLDAVMDRVENGDFVYDQKAGVLKRKPANLRDVARVSVDMLSKRELLRGNATERRENSQVSVSEQLKLLATEFAKWQTPAKPTIDVEMVEVVDAKEVLPEGNEASEVVADTDISDSLLDSNQQGGLEPPDEAKQPDGGVGGESWYVGGTTDT
jgi:transposase-like protein